MLVLEVVDGCAKGSVYRFDKGEVIIGRGVDADVRVDDRGVSRRHARICRDGGGYSVEDLGSLNGTEVNGDLVKKGMLGDGDSIRIGDWACRVAMPAANVAHNAATAAAASVTMVDDQHAAKTPSIEEVVDAEKSLAMTPVRVDRANLDQAFTQLRLLIEVGEAMGGSQSPDQLLEMILDQVFKAFPQADNGLIMLLNPETGALEPKISRTGSAAAHAGESAQVMVSRTIADRAIKDRQSLLLSDAQKDERFAAAMSVVNLNLRSTMCVPLLHGEKVLGLIQVSTRSLTRRYTRDELGFLTALGAEAALAIENAALVEDLRRKNVELTETNEQLTRTLREIDTLRNVKEHMSKFVPEAARRRIEENPSTPMLDKREQDVSIVFLDIGGYTRITEGAGGDQRRVDHIVESYFSRFLDAIYKYGGDINEIAGDGLMIIFQDDDPAQHAMNAVAAAVNIERETAAINKESAAGEPPICINIGINSGAASVGSVRFEGLAGTRWTFTASGATTIMAARLAALAESGCVLVGPETAKRCGSLFCLSDLGEKSLKNMSRPVRVHRVNIE